jgi:hypothetical protein
MKLRRRIRLLSFVVTATFLVPLATFPAAHLPAFRPARPSAHADDPWRTDVERMLQEFLSCAEPIDDRSPCNIFLARALDRVYGIKEFGDPTRPASVMRANEIADYVAARTDLWVPLGTGDKQDSLNQAQEYANRSKAIIAVWKNPEANRPGHVALILPGQLSTSTSWQLRVPNSASFSLDRPRDSYVGGPLSKAFGAGKKAQVKIYGHV